MNPLKMTYYIMRYLGPRVVWLRAGVFWDKVWGTSRRVFRSRPWESLAIAEITLPGTPTDPAAYREFKHQQEIPFLFPLGQPPQVPPPLKTSTVARQPDLAERLRLLAEDRCVYFFRTPSPEPIDWYVNPIDGHRSEPGRLWCDTPTYRPEQGDPRMMWEPARAAWAIDLARAKSHGFESDAGGLYWRWIDSFMNACPPFEGFQWMCGQESSVRMIAVALGFWSVANDPATTPERYQQMLRLAWATGYRVCHHINYAVSQKNNHAMSEATGLLLIAQLFPELREAASWHKIGRRVLANEIRRQVYDDGSYLQQSMNYERVMLAGSLLGLRLAELSGEPFERDIYERLGRCALFLHQMMEPQTGRLPQYGNNDGAHVLPLNECDFNDFRPIIQAVHYLVTRKRLLPVGAWDEDLLWLFGPEALTAPEDTPPPLKSMAFETGGYYTLRQKRSWGLLRCHTYRDRVAQCDALNLDVWHDGHNVVQDAGLYKYYIPGRSDLEHYFRSTKAHNVVEIGDQSPLTLASRFLWFPWTRAQKRRFEAAPDGLQLFEGEHFDYHRSPWRVIHRRSVVVDEHGRWVVIDDLLGSGKQSITLRWHLCDFPYEFDADKPGVSLQMPSGEFGLSVAADGNIPLRSELIRGRDVSGSVQGFVAPYYGEKLPIPTLEVRTEAELPVRLITTMGAGRFETPLRQMADAQGERWLLAGSSGQVRLDLSPPRHDTEKTVLAYTSMDSAPGAQQRPADDR